MDPLQITGRTRRVLQAIFPASLWIAVEDMLAVDCSAAQVHAAGFDAAAMERIWLAALKLSGGSMDGLERAVRLARIDWRDVLVGAGFGSDLRAHLAWAAEAGR